MNRSLAERLSDQRFANDYRLVDGVAMNRDHPEQFRIPPPVIKRHIGAGHFVELRIDSPRFSVHEDAAEKCACPSCNGEMTKPILRHEHPASLVPLPEHSVPARGWGEDFWIQIQSCQEDLFLGIVDNPLVESRLHGLKQGDEVVCHADHVLAIHQIHRQELMSEMDTEDLRELAAWLRSLEN